MKRSIFLKLVAYLRHILNFQIMLCDFHLLSSCPKLKSAFRNNKFVKHTILMGKKEGV